MENESIERENKNHVREVKRALRKEKIKNRFFQEHDIKYQGPLSYRALRIIAWLAIIAGQLVLINSIGKSMLHWSPLGDVWPNILSVFSLLSTPLFIVASFGLVLNRKRVIFNFIFMYGAAFLGIGIGVNLFYYRYVAGLFAKMSADSSFIFDIITNFAADHVQINVFADLFAFSLFNLFINHTPEKVFVGKKLIIFRLFAILPVAYIVTSYVLKILSSVHGLNLPFFVHPFLTTKSPIIFLIFALVALWIKNRERIFLSIGATKEEYQEFLLTNRNSLSFSVHLSLLILLAALLEAVVDLAVFIFYGDVVLSGELTYASLMTSYGLGECIPLLVAIPILFLYSNTRTYKNTMIDITIPIVGIGGVVLVYIEGIYHFLTQII